MVATLTVSVISQAIEAWQEREQLLRVEQEQRAEAERDREMLAQSQRLHGLLREASRVLRREKLDLADHLCWHKPGEEIDGAVTDVARPYLAIDGLAFYHRRDGGLMVRWPDGCWAVIQTLADLGACLMERREARHG